LSGGVIHLVAGIAVTAGIVVVAVRPAIIGVVANHRLVTSIVNIITVLVLVSIARGRSYRITDDRRLGIGVIVRIGIRDIGRIVIIAIVIVISVVIITVVAVYLV
jgi:hypothetical protein